MRIDLLLSEKEGITRTRAQNLIKTGGVRLNGEIVLKPSQDVDPAASLQVVDTLKYASLGGLKLENAFYHFAFTPKGMHCLDVGASNGGFTDCLLHFGAAEVSSTDLHLAFPARLSEDPRVRYYDRINAKELTPLFPKESFDLITVDLSFISLCAVLDVLSVLLKPSGAIVALFKPQFEVGRKALPKSGVVRDEKEISKALARVVECAVNNGLEMKGSCDVPDVFPDKNKERTILFIKV